jgi:hypothetical protein
MPQGQEEEARKVIVCEERFAVFLVEPRALDSAGRFFLAPAPSDIDRGRQPPGGTAIEPAIPRRRKASGTRRPKPRLRPDLARRDKQIGVIEREQAARLAPLLKPGQRLVRRRETSGAGQFLGRRRCHRPAPPGSWLARTASPPSRRSSRACAAT